MKIQNAALLFFVSCTGLFAAGQGNAVVRKAFGSMDPEQFLAFLRGGSGQAFFEGRTPFAVFFLTLLGGIMLNLTPCVLPMIPINLSIIGAGGSAKKSHAVLRAGVYSLGMMLAYGGAGAASALGFSQVGGIASLWYVNLGAAVLFIILGLAMFDCLNIDLTRFRSAVHTPGTVRLAGIFLAGGVMALLSGACVAPVVIAVLIHSATLYARGGTYGILLPFVLGLGMGLPWPLLAAGFAGLPKPGAWMKYIKYTFGILIMSVGLYYGWTAWRLFRPVPAADGNAEWTLEEACKRSRQTGKPVLVDFRADWCKNCLAMESGTLKDPEVLAVLRKDFIVVRFDATQTDSPEVRRVLDRYDIKGLPAYLILQPE